MEHSISRTAILASQAKALFQNAGHLNLYLSRCHVNRHPDFRRVGQEVERLKKNIRSIEIELAQLHALGEQ